MRSDQLEFFMSCAACLNFSLAAKYHFVSVSTLSRGIDALEDEMGFKLFKRGYHGHELTEVGKALFDGCIETFLNYEYFLREWSDIAQEALTIGCKPYDGSFERLVTAYSKASTEYLSLKPKVVFIPEARLSQCLNDGIINIILTDKQEAPEGMFVVPFCRSGVREYVFCSKDTLDEISLTRLSKLSSFIK